MRHHVVPFWGKKGTEPEATLSSPKGLPTARRNPFCASGNPFGATGNPLGTEERRANRFFGENGIRTHGAL